MGMVFSIVSKEVKTRIYLPGKLNYFFERIGGWSQRSEYYQICSILNVPLHYFDFNHGYVGHPDRPAKPVSLDEISQVMSDLLKAMDAEPSFYDRVIYSPSYGERDFWSLKFKSYDEIPKNWHEYPDKQDNYHYLSQGKFRRDL